MNTATRTNLFVLRTVFGTSAAVANRVSPPHRSHLARCIAAGLVTATRETLTLTDAGVAAVASAR